MAEKLKLTDPFYRAPGTYKVRLRKDLEPFLFESFSQTFDPNAVYEASLPNRSGVIIIDTNDGESVGVAHTMFEGVKDEVS
ncbi:hypothetical protein K2Q08_00305 [Patescibacteria group bacterium]|nr:hypothetical protein [Patescibacteria group bacterium]